MDNGEHWGICNKINEFSKLEYIRIKRLLMGFFSSFLIVLSSHFHYIEGYLIYIFIRMKNELNTKVADSSKQYLKKK